MMWEVCAHILSSCLCISWHKLPYYTLDPLRRNYLTQTKPPTWAGQVADKQEMEQLWRKEPPASLRNGFFPWQRAKGRWPSLKNFMQTQHTGLCAYQTHSRQVHFFNLVFGRIMQWCKTRQFCKTAMTKWPKLLKIEIVSLPHFSFVKNGKT